MWSTRQKLGLFLLLAIFVQVESVEKLALQELTYSLNATLDPSKITDIVFCGTSLQSQLPNIVANSADNSNPPTYIRTLYGLDATCNVTEQMKNNKTIPIVLSFGAVGDVITTVELSNNTQTLVTATSAPTPFTPQATTTPNTNVTTPTPTPSPTTVTTTNPSSTTAPPPTTAPLFPPVGADTTVTITLNYRYLQPADVQNVDKHTAAVVVAVLEGLILGAILAVFIYRVYTGAKRSQNAAMYGADPYADATQNRSYDNNAWGNPPPRNNGISMDTMSPRTTQPTPQEARPNLVPVDLNSPQPRAPIPRPPADPLQDPWSDRVPAPGTRDQDPFDGYGY